MAQSRGFALLIVLWSVVLLALLATGITAAGRTDIQLAGNVRRAAAADAAAEAGIQAAIFHLSDAPGRSWPADGRTQTIPFGRYRLAIRVLDEARKVNPNYAPTDLMAALLASAGADPTRAAALAASIADWHQPGIEDAQAARYRAAGLGAAPTGNQFRSVDDLRLVIGMPQAVFARLRPMLSVHAEPPLNVEQADPLVRAALRSLGTDDPPPSNARPTVVEIFALATGTDGSRAERHAIVSLGPDGTGRLFRRIE